jgi:hypothetical protein
MIFVFRKLCKTMTRMHEYCGRAIVRRASAYPTHSDNHRSALAQVAAKGCGKKTLDAVLRRPPYLALGGDMSPARGNDLDSEIL